MAKRRTRRKPPCARGRLWLLFLLASLFSTSASLCCGFILANGIHVTPGTNPPDFPSDCEGTFAQQSDVSNGMATYKNGAHWIFYTGSFWTCASSYSATTGLFLNGAAGLDCPSPNSDGTNWKVCTSSGGCTEAVGGNNPNYLMSVTCV